VNWAIYLTSIGIIIAIAGFFLKHIQDKNAAAREALVLRIDLLEAQLKDAERRSPDILLDQLTKRIHTYEEELVRLSKDRDKNEGLIKTKEEELRQTKELQTALENEIEQHLREYSQLEDKLDVCPTCQSALVELTYIDAEEDSGQLKRYECGYSEIDAYIKKYCPFEEDIPPISEFKMWTQKHILFEQWRCYLEPTTEDARKVIIKEVWGGSEDEACENMKKAYKERFRKEYPLVEP